MGRVTRFHSGMDAGYFHFTAAVCRLLRGMAFAMASIAASCLGQAVVVTDVRAAQRYPWNGLVDVSFTAAGAKGRRYGVSFVATDLAAGTNLAVKTLYKTDGSRVAELETLVNGTNRWIWDAGTDLRDGTNLERVRMSVTVTENEDGSLGGVQLWENGPYWAECNVGATKPEECGYYFQWGDTVGYRPNPSDNGWVSVQTGESFSFNSDHLSTYKKTVPQLWAQDYLDVDRNGGLAEKYDAATAYLGVPWRMPTDMELSALTNNCTTTWTTRNGVSGRLVTGKGAFSTRSIFLPAAGSYGYYWSSTPFRSSESSYASCLSFSQDNFYLDGRYRERGFLVRPLRGRLAW